MSNVLKNIRFYILVGSILLSLALYVQNIAMTSLSLSQIANLVEEYGLLSLFFLYLSLLQGSLYYTFSMLPFRTQCAHARRALGVAAFYFAFLHTAISFFGQLGGFAGLGFLDNNYLIAILLGFIALCIFSLLAVTSFDWVIAKLSFPKWKLLHRFVYLAGVLVLIHTAMLGTHFSNLSGTISQFTYVALAFLLLLEAPRLDVVLQKFIPLPKLGISFLLVAVLTSAIYVTSINPLFPASSGGVSFDVHAAHRQLAQQALQASQNSTTANTLSSTIPGLSGDRTKRYTVSMTTDPIDPQPNQDVTIHFTVYDASSGTKITFLRSLYTKPMHCIIVNSDLTYFNHIHPLQDDQGNFSVTTQFPTNDMYHVYIEFWPFGGIEQEIGFTIPVGQLPNPLTFSHTQPDTDKKKVFGEYTVSVNTHGGLQAQDLSVGLQTISFTITNTITGRPVTTLQPYLASFGHLTMIQEQTFDFIHVHPYSLTTPPPHAVGGPTVDFLPIGIYGPFKPGIYRMFGEFNPDGHLFVADFTVKIN